MAALRSAMMSRACLQSAPSVRIRARSLLPAGASRGPRFLGQCQAGGQAAAAQAAAAQAAAAVPSGGEGWRCNIGQASALGLQAGHGARSGLAASPRSFFSMLPGPSLLNTVPLGRRGLQPAAHPPKAKNDRRRRVERELQRQRNARRRRLETAAANVRKSIKAKER